VCGFFFSHCNNSSLFIWKFLLKFIYIITHEKAEYNCKLTTLYLIGKQGDSSVLVLLFVQHSNIRFFSSLATVLMQNHNVSLVFHLSCRFPWEFQNSFYFVEMSLLFCGDVCFMWDIELFASSFEICFTCWSSQWTKWK
jgi:hypothetical protein